MIRTGATFVGATGAAYSRCVTLDAYLKTHRPIGFLLSAEQMVVVIAYLVRRPARVVTQRMGDWLLAFGGTFAPVLLRPNGLHPAWGLTWGLVLQFCGVVLCLLSFLALGRSFGFAAADRGLVRRGPYRIVRHPIYAASRDAPRRLPAAEPVAPQRGRRRARDGLQRGQDTEQRSTCWLPTPLSKAVYRSRIRWRLLPGIW